MFGSVLVNLAVNTPYLARRETFTVPSDLSLLGGGTFSLCGIVDPEGNFTESSESDNSAKSDRTFTVYGNLVCQ